MLLEGVDCDVEVLGRAVPVCLLNEDGPLASQMEHIEVQPGLHLHGMLQG